MYKLYDTKTESPNLALAGDIPLVQVLFTVVLITLLGRVPFFA